MSTTGNLRDFKVTGNLQKNHINLIKHLILYTIDINWSAVTLKLGNTGIVLSNVVTVPLIDKYQIRNFMETTILFSYIMLLTGVTLQAPHNPKCISYS